jgi:hypothetical protein
MVISSQLQIIQSPITSLLSTVATVVAVKLDDSNYLTWNFQMQILLESHGILGFVVPSSVLADFMQTLILRESNLMNIRYGRCMIEH